MQNTKNSKTIPGYCVTESTQLTTLEHPVHGTVYLDFEEAAHILAEKNVSNIDLRQLSNKMFNVRELLLEANLPEGTSLESYQEIILTCNLIHHFLVGLIG